MKNTNLGPLPKHNPREDAVNEASLEYSRFVQDWIARNSLTTSESLLIITNSMRFNLEYCVINERREVSTKS